MQASQLRVISSMSYFKTSGYCNSSTAMKEAFCFEGQIYHTPLLMANVSKDDVNQQLVVVEGIISRLFKH